MEPLSFEDYARTRGPGLLRFAGVLSGDRGTAEDVVQEVLVRAARRWASICALDAPDAYVRRMVVNEYLSWRRKWSRLIPTEGLLDDHEGGRGGTDFADTHAEREALARRLDALPPKQRAALVLRFYEDLPDREIGEVLGCPIGTVRSHISRALAALRVDQRDATPAHSRARKGSNDGDY
jgi:RNA polymerase sigma-70 factor (sigma-E family)